MLLNYKAFDSIPIETHFLKQMILVTDRQIIHVSTILVNNDIQCEPSFKQFLVMPSACHLVIFLISSSSSSLSSTILRLQQSCRMQIAIVLITFVYEINENTFNAESLLNNVFL